MGRIQQFFENRIFDKDKIKKYCIVKYGTDIVDPQELLKEETLEYKTLLWGNKKLELCERWEYYFQQYKISGIRKSEYRIVIINDIIEDGEI